MGKSPAKWIKTVLFGKKSTRSHASKGKNATVTSDKEYSGGLPALAVSSPVISEPILVSTVSNGTVPEVEKGTASNSNEVTLPTNQDTQRQGITGSKSSNDPEQIRQEQAAIKAQAAFRGYLARRAFRALRGIIRLQALVRGHLVRRQAVATLRSMQAIVKLQAIVRGQSARCSGVGLEISTKSSRRTAVEAKSLVTWSEKLATNTFTFKLISSTVAMPLQVQYEKEDSNSVYSWLDRWTSARVWKPRLQPKKAIDSKTQNKRGSYAMETESGRSKRTVRRNSAGGTESSSTVVLLEPEKSRRSTRKVSSSPIESVQEHPQSELEKVKRSLRKVSSITVETSDRPEVEIEKLNRNLRKVPNTPSDVPCQAVDELIEKGKKDVAPNLEIKPDLESATKLVVEEDPIDELLDNHSPVESYPLQSIDKEHNFSVTNGELNSKEDQISHENQKSSKRRASFSVKTEYAESGLQNTPPLPSYMATTESSKAKLRGQSSPRLVSDSAERDGITRRHSLPSNNGKLSSHSPRTQKLAQASGKGAVKTDRSLSSSRDGNEKPIQVEWRR